MNPRYCIRMERMVAGLLFLSEYVPQLSITKTVKWPYASLSDMFSPLHSVKNEETGPLKSMENLDNFHQMLGSHYTTLYNKLIPCTVSNDKWDTKEDTGKSMKHALYTLRYEKRHQSGRSE